MMSYNSFSQSISINRSAAIEIKKGLLQGEYLKEENRNLKSIIELQDGVITRQDSVLFNKDLLLVSSNNQLTDKTHRLEKSRLHKVILGLALALSVGLHFSL